MRGMLPAKMEMWNLMNGLMFHGVQLVNNSLHFELPSFIGEISSSIGWSEDGLDFRIVSFSIHVNLI